MNISEEFKLLESLFVELDPLEDGFGGRCSRFTTMETGTYCWSWPPLPATSCSGSPRRIEN